MAEIGFAPAGCQIFEGGAKSGESDALECFYFANEARGAFFLHRDVITDLNEPGEGVDELPPLPPHLYLLLLGS